MRHIHPDIKVPSAYNRVTPQSVPKQNQFEGSSTEVSENHSQHKHTPTPTHPPLLSTPPPPSPAAWERGAYGAGVTLHVINLVKLHWQRGSSRGHMSLSVDGNT